MPGPVAARTRRSLLLLLAAVSEARRRGDDYALMSLVEPAASCSTPTAAERSGSACPEFTSAGPGRGLPGLILVPCYTEVLTFVGDLLGHLRKRPDDQFSQLTEPLCR